MNKMFICLFIDGVRIICQA